MTHERCLLDAKRLLENVRELPKSRESATAFTNLQQSIFWLQEDERLSELRNLFTDECPCTPGNYSDNCKKHGSGLAIVPPKGALPTAARARIREYVSRRITEARWQIADCEEMNAYVLKIWIERHETGLVELLEMIDGPSSPSSVFTNGQSDK